MICKWPSTEVQFLSHFTLLLTLRILLNSEWYFNIHPASKPNMSLKNILAGRQIQWHCNLNIQNKRQEDCYKFKASPAMVAHTFFVSVLWRQRQAIWIPSQSHLQNEFRHSQGNTVRLCLKSHQNVYKYLICWWTILLFPAKFKVTEHKGLLWRKGKCLLSHITRTEMLSCLMQSLRVSSYRTQKRINIQNDNVLLYTNRFYVYKRISHSDLKEKRSYFPFWWRTNYAHRYRDKKWNESTEQKVCHKARWGIQPTAKLKSDHTGPPAPSREAQTWSWKAASFSTRSDIKISWVTWDGDESLVKQFYIIPM